MKERMFKVLAQACGTVAVVLLSIGLLATVAAGQAFGDGGGPAPLNCGTDCVCSVAPCSDDSCHNADGCSTKCKCQDKAGSSGCECATK